MLSPALFTLFALADPAAGSLPTFPAKLPVTEHKTAIRRLLPGFFNSAAWRSLDPTWPATVSSDARVFRFKTQHVTRVTPYVASDLGPLKVEGADRVMVFHGRDIVEINKREPLIPTGSFQVTPDTATKLAVTQVPGSLLTPNRAAGRNLARPVYLRQEGRLRAAWRVRVPTLRLQDLADVWIDATNGDILRRQPVAKFAAPTAAEVYQPAPPTFPANPTAVGATDLSNLAPGEVGDYLLGWHLKTTNCCKQFSCATLPDVECDIRDPQDPGFAASLADRVCEADNASGAGIFESRMAIGIPAELLGVPFVETLYFDMVVCTDAQRLKSEVSGWFPEPVDGGSAAAETDGFAELQAYWATQTYFEHIRDVLADDTFCLGPDSMACNSNGTATDSNPTDGVPDLPFHISTNFLFPDVITQQGQDAILDQISDFRGLTPQNPVLVDEFARIDNAAFVPKSDNTGIPPEFEDLAGLFARPYDSNLYFQGTADFAYDGDVVAHEFTHAIVHSFVPTLQSLDHDVWGSSAWPGALNEGWSDYFAASWTGDSVTGEYASGPSGGNGIRNADNTDRCPHALIGEVHQDSLPWSGALWDLREAVLAGGGQVHVKALDALLLMTMAQSADNETAEMQAERILAALTADPTLDAYVVDANAAFAAHQIIDCARVIPLVTVSGNDVNTFVWEQQLHQPAPESVSLTNMAPSVLQFSIGVPAGAPGFSIQWTQSGANPQPVLSVVVNEGGPIEWSYSAGLAEPHDHHGAAIPFDPADLATQARNGTPNNQGELQASYSFSTAPDCDHNRVYFVSLVSSTGAMIQTDTIALPLAPLNPDPCTTGTGGSGGAGGSGGTSGSGGSTGTGGGTGTGGASATGGTGGSNPGDPGGGCSCQNNAGSPLLVLALLALFMVARRRLGVSPAQTTGPAGDKLATDLWSGLPTEAGACRPADLRGPYPRP